MKLIPVSRLKYMQGALDSGHGQRADEHRDLGLVPLRRRVLLLGRHAPPRLVLLAELPPGGVAKDISRETRQLPRETTPKRVARFPENIHPPLESSPTRP